jgi:uncharacterized membrane protein YkoI
MIARGACKGMMAAVLAVAALLVVDDAAIARPRSLSLTQDQPDVEPSAPAQQDGFVPAQRGGGVSLQQATAMARRQFPGQVVKAETVRVGDRLVHEIRILGEDGRVRNVRIDAETGAVL